MNSRRFITNSAPDALNPSVSNFWAKVQALGCPLRAFSTELGCPRHSLGIGLQILQAETPSIGGERRLALSVLNVNFEVRFDELFTLKC